MRIAISVLIAAMCWVADSHASVREPALRAHLLEMRKKDQDARKQGDFVAGMAIDKANTARLKEITKAYGWPTISMVGEDGAQAAFLLAQHADHEPDFQRHVLALMTALLGAGEVFARNVAYLHDRTHTPQRYGTQGACAGPGSWKPREIEAPEAVDQRRVEVGIRPEKLSEYVAFMNTLCK